MKPTLALLVLAGCGPSFAPAPAHSGTAAARSPCEVPDSAHVTHLRATRDGAVFVSDTDDGPVAQRLEGLGCALRPDATAKVAIDRLLGTDDLGRLYAFPRAARDHATVSTLLPGERREGYVARVDRAGRIARLLEAGRGIWGFGVSPGGDAAYYVGCDPGGVRPVLGEALSRAPSMASPDTLWNETDSVLTDAQTFWSLGQKPCRWDEPMSSACGHPLVKTTPEGSSEVGAAALDLGNGFERAQLASCGPRVCGLFAQAKAVVVWNAEGERAHTLHPARDDEAILEISGNAVGVYLLLAGPRGTRVLFVDAP